MFTATYVENSDVRVCGECEHVHTQKGYMLRCTVGEQFVCRECYSRLSEEGRISCTSETSSNETQEDRYVQIYLGIAESANASARKSFLFAGNMKLLKVILGR